MPNVVKIYVEEIATQIATYATIRLYRGTTPNVTTASTLAGTATLVAGQEEYSITDASGVAGSWYRYTLYNATGAVESSLSPAWRSDGQSLRVIRLEAARQSGNGYDSTCTALGSPTTLIDKALVDEGVDAEFLEGAWIYRPDAVAAGDMLRRVKPDGFAVATFTLSIDSDRPWTNAPASAEEYHIYNLLPPIDAAGQPYSWDRAVRDGLNDVWYADQLNLGEGTAGAQGRFALTTHLGYIARSQVRRVLLRTSRTVGAETLLETREADKNGGWWDFYEDGPGLLSVEIHPAPGTDETVLVEVNRPHDGIYIDADVTDCPLEIAWRAAVWKAYGYLNSRFRGKFAAEHALAQQDFLDEYRKIKPLAYVGGA